MNDIICEIKRSLAIQMDISTINRSSLFLRVYFRLGWRQGVAKYELYIKNGANIFYKLWSED